MTEKIEESIFDLLINRLDLFFLDVTDDGFIHFASPSFLDRFGPASLTIPVHFSAFIGEGPYNELFANPGRFEPRLGFYRAHILTKDHTKKLCEISGIREDVGGKGHFLIMVRELPSLLQSAEAGLFLENAKAHSIVRRYVSEGLREKARDSVRSGFDHIANERKNLTFFFADMVSFTAFSERKTPEEIVEVLNLSIGAASSNILHWNGHVDKLMGDSIFAIFDDPLNAILAGIEMQKQIQLLNLFNIKNDQDEIQVRVGINSGECLRATIGTEDFQEWTAIGDAVNTASRLEKSAAPGTVLVSKETCDPLREKLQIVKEIQIEVKGKTSAIHACYVNRVTFEGDRGTMSLGLDDELF